MKSPLTTTKTLILLVITLPVAGYLMDNTMLGLILGFLFLLGFLAYLPMLEIFKPFDPADIAPFPFEKADLNESAQEDESIKTAEQ